MVTGVTRKKNFVLADHTEKDAMLYQTNHQVQANVCVLVNYYVFTQNANLFQFYFILVPGILNKYWCDGVWDCPDGSDETECTLNKKSKHHLNRLKRQVYNNSLKQHKFAAAIKKFATQMPIRKSRKLQNKNLSHWIGNKMTKK